nr:PREDICTED: alpha-2-macroglobulin [Latimeria chalumnae]|eukprot:XP_014351977.1 PREDICTED: alpha-2-macroglobulin [Latimeria chalumnae]
MEDLAIPSGRRHLVVIPAKIYSRATEKVCAHLIHLHEPLKITVTLEYDGKNVTLLEREVKDSHWYQCVNFKKEMKFRIILLDEKLTVANQKYPQVYIKDPKDNIIFRWLDVETQQGIADLHFNLPSEAQLGEYSIFLKKENEFSTRRDQYFTVQEPVLSRFHIQTKVPEAISVLDEQFHVEFCGKYTHGKPVRGELCFKVCEHTYHHYYTENANCRYQIFTAKLDTKGCFSQVISMKMFNLTDEENQRNLLFTATLTEEGTGVIASEEGAIGISITVAGVRLKNAERSYQQGIPYLGMITAKKFDETPLPNETISLVITINDEATTQNYTTDNSGNVYFKLDTTSWGNNTVELEAKLAQEDKMRKYGRNRPWYGRSFLIVKPFHPESGNILVIQPILSELSCDTEQAVQVDYRLRRKEFGKSISAVDFYYLVTSKGEIILEGHKELALSDKEEMNGMFSVSLPVTAHLAPVAKMLIYTILPDGEVLVDTARFQISSCFRNKVNLKFSVPEEFPGANVNLQLQASPGSLCSIRAVDKSVILRSDKELTINSVYNKLQEVIGYPFEVDEYPDSCRTRKRKRSSTWKHWGFGVLEAFTLFKFVNLKIITDAQILTPCPDDSKAIEGVDTPILSRTTRLLHSKPEKEKKEMIRKYFPQTWIWDLVPVGPSGEKQVPVHIPDTITEWKAGMFCIADAGFGLTPPVYFNSFKPYFMDFTLPYSVVRGETFTLKATAFNYLSHCIMVHVTLQQTEDFLAKPCENCIYTSCLCADETKTFSWDITTKSTGDINFAVRAEAIQSNALCENEVVAVPEKGAIDTVIKSLPVKMEGFKKEKTYSSLICTADSMVTEKISLTLPDTVVEDSVGSSVAVLGNIMSLSLHYPELLLDMPMGCGEQVMSPFTNNAYGLQYLEKTGLVNDHNRATAIKNMEKGYMKILQHKTKNGSYAIFDASEYIVSTSKEERGNAWLTAYVVSSFNKAKPYIFIEERLQTEAINWISSKQMDDGCFTSDTVYHGIWSASTQTIAVSAYITAALLELKDPSLEAVVKRGLSCLKNHFMNETSIYNMALMAYTFTLAGDDDMRETLLQKLDTLAVREAELVHWKEDEDELTWYSSSGMNLTNLEMTSYVLLALMSKPNVTSSDITSAYKIVKWIITQQNSLGGFSSSQVTVVTLKALAKFAEHVYKKDSVNTVTVKSDKGFVKEFHVDNTNSLLLQKADVPLPIAYTTEVTGNGCVIVQATLKYNVPQLKSESGFSISVETIPQMCAESGRTAFDLKIKVGYTGKRPVSNMVIIDVSMLSGFIPVKKSVKLLNQTALVGRTETKANQVIIYLEQLTSEKQEYTFTVEQDFVVETLKPASVKIYDSYNTDEHATTEYSAPDCHH